MANVTFSGGDKLKALFDKAGKGGVRNVEVGVFASAKYPDGTLVAAVAAWNEFGTVNSPERPALRNSIKDNEKTLAKIVRLKVDPEKMVITPKIAVLLGLSQQGAMQKSIVSLSSPGNAESTKKAKGSSNPLIGKHGLYLKSITYKVNR